MEPACGTCLPVICVAMLGKSEGERRRCEDGGLRTGMVYLSESEGYWWLDIYRQDWKRSCQRIFYLSCFWPPSESNWAISSMWFPTLPHFHRKNINIFYLICNPAPSSINQTSRYKTVVYWSQRVNQCSPHSLGDRNARKVRRRKKEFRRQRPSNWDGVSFWFRVIVMIWKIDMIGKGVASASFTWVVSGHLPNQTGQYLLCGFPPCPIFRGKH